MTLREGPGAIGVERIGRVAEALHAALLQSAPPEPGGDPILHVFPAWPKEWSAQYTLSARGGFLVTSSFTGGKVGFVELRSRVGGECRVRNPWEEAGVDLYRDGKRGETLHGPLLRFAVKEGETVVLAPAGVSPDAVKAAV